MSSSQSWLQKCAQRKHWKPPYLWIQTHPSLREHLNAKVDLLEKGSQQAKDQLAELTRTANDYSMMLQKKEDEIVRLASEVAASKRERTQLQKDVVDIRALMQAELDELRAVMETKTTEVTRRREVEKSKDEELASLRRQTADIQKQLENSHTLLLEREKAANEQSNKAEAAMMAIEKSKRTLESELQALRAKQVDSDSQLAGALTAKEVEYLIP